VQDFNQALLIFFDFMLTLKQNFFSEKTLIVARKLLGKKIIHKCSNRLLSGIIVETEAYAGSIDTACHTYKGKTARNSVMFGPAGIAYVYFIYGMHYMLNIVTEGENSGCAVLLRAIIPVQGKKQMENLRGKKGKDLTNGPAKLCQAMAIDKAFNGLALTPENRLWLENYKTIPNRCICTGPRIGINYATQKDQKAPWRFWVKNDWQLGLA